MQGYRRTFNGRSMSISWCTQKVGSSSGSCDARLWVKVLARAWGRGRRSLSFHRTTVCEVCAVVESKECPPYYPSPPKKWHHKQIFDTHQLEIKNLRNRKILYRDGAVSWARFGRWIWMWRRLCRVTSFKDIWQFAILYILKYLQFYVFLRYLQFYMFWSSSFVVRQVCKYANLNTVSLVDFRKH